MTSTLWQSYHLAKEPFKKTQEKVEIFALVLVWVFLVGCGGKKRGGNAYSIFLVQQVNFNALSAYSGCSEQAAHQLEARILLGHCKLFL